MADHITSASGSSQTSAEPDSDAAFRLVSGLMVSAHVAGLVSVGVRLGLYRAMAGAGWMTSEELAEAAGADERWVREWLSGQAAAGVLIYGDGAFRLPDAMLALLADEGGLMYLGATFAGLPNRIGLVPALEQCFRTGRGLTFDERGAEAAADTEAMFGAFYRQLLVPMALPLLDGVVDRLKAGARVADVGCGAGVALIEMAKAFPASQFDGYDVSEQALKRAEDNLRAAGVSNVTFHDATDDGLPDQPSFDLITTFDCLHDMTRPHAVAAAIRQAINDDGVWFIADINCAPTLEENLARRQFAAMMYSISVYSCMSSALSEPGGAGLGTCGLPEPAMRRLVTEAGFGTFRRVDFDHPVNAFYEARP